jgi:hypothetical protein
MLKSLRKEWPVGGRRSARQKNALLEERALRPLRMALRAGELEEKAGCANFLESAQRIEDQNKS